MDYYGGGMGGGGQQQQMMMSSSISAVSMSLILGGLGFLAWNQGWFGLNKGSGDGTGTGTGTGTETGDATANTTTTTTTVETADLGGTRLIMNGIYSMKVVGTSCGNQRVVFSQADGGKWLWNLKTNGYIDVDGQETPVYTIESYYRLSREACAERYLTAPEGCNSPPFLSAYMPMAFSQRWILVKDGANKYQIRSLLCVRNEQFNQYIINSGGKNQSEPVFSRGSGTPFDMPAASASSGL